MDNQVDKYSFITVIKIGINTHQMMIPPDFVKYCDEDFSSTNVILIGPSGDPCRVTILEKDEIFMQDGWPRFLRNNLVEENELLLFTYEGDNCFRVQIFGLNACERLNTKIAPQRVPKKLIVDFSLNLPQNITLLCCEHDGRNDVPYLQTLPEETHVRKSRRTVTGELQKWKDGRIFYKGWARFCRVNKIDMKKDECICEFVMGEDEQIQMLQVHVVKNGLLMSAT
ncbi:hypothetical protein TanjilG_17258 [Lupinus angustifolius]|uniref:TF-B3 domain-containing protein n=1 Tax=Lupinus angustifolius TaxID=3871 RepID=A0A4P1R161_LUPAN|nr:hypothetical protein TanjilG_17258 [Lupinus angustifolius]